MKQSNASMMMSTTPGQETPAGGDAEFDVYSEIEKLLDKDLQARKFEIYSFYHDILGFISTKIDSRPNIMHAFIHAIN